VIEADSQAAPNTLTEDDLQDAFKNRRSAGHSAYAWNGTTAKAMVACKPKVRCEQMAQTFLQIVDSSGIFVYKWFLATTSLSSFKHMIRHSVFK
jgi:hypothetical protein